MPLPQEPEELEQAPASHPEEAEQEVPERKTDAGSEPEKDLETNLQASETQPQEQVRSQPGRSDGKCTDKRDEVDLDVLEAEMLEKAP
ncbi:hypothetical protein TGFOU_407080 [Toxoplasma gondii FOU]|uniref:Dense granule protein GRA11 n=1 Tax=Toxoplasma gondii FOU TaxID=943167 RepID=A0A086JEW0_TOXGO|nr:hypothetical protein TGFOU_407080 [Toxoplasma gondii FOU]